VFRGFYLPAFLFSGCILRRFTSMNNIMQPQLSQIELVAWRLAGKLPHIDINGTDFTIDLRLGELRETDAPWNRIDISELETAHDSNDRLFFFETRQHTA
jgi:hypothetical protein